MQIDLGQNNSYAKVVNFGVAYPDSPSLEKQALRNMWISLWEALEGAPRRKLVISHTTEIEVGSWDCWLAKRGHAYTHPSSVKCVAEAQHDESTASRPLLASAGSSVTEQRCCLPQSSLKGWQGRFDQASVRHLSTNSLPNEARTFGLLCSALHCISQEGR